MRDGNEVHAEGGQETCEHSRSHEGTVRAASGGSPPANVTRPKKKFGLREQAVETDKFVAVAQSYWARIKKSGQRGEETEVRFPIRRIDVYCKRSDEVFRFPLTVRRGVATFGDTRESALIDNRRTPPEMTAELARMLGRENADRLLSTLLVNTRVIHLPNLSKPT